MKRLLFSILAVAAILCGCAREIEPEGSTMVPVSKYLVIKADCTPMTKTDINEGKSTWEAGDKITVLYNGDAYEYVAGTPSEDGEQTYFTSSAGITSYDGTGLVAYYQALSAEDGTVGIAAERNIAFQKEGQVNSACAPLVGSTSAETMEDGVLNMYFQNIFSVVELRIDAAGYHVNSPARTLKVEPADGSDFSGYLTCSATVDASTLALETSSTGNSLTLNLPDGTELREPQTLKFPVGRFTSSKGLKLTLTLEDGTVYQKNVYKTGLSTYVENNGRYAVQHLARAIFPFSGGISTAGDLVDFAAAVNSGASFLEYMNDEGKVVLLDDIDMSGVTSWTPIGNGTFTGQMTGDNVCSYSGSSFKGKFDGQGFSIRNLKLSKDLTAEGAVYGLFGILDGAVVENIVLGAPENDNSSFEFSADATSDAGVLSGVCYGSVIRNCTNYIPMNVKGNSVSGKRTTMGAFAGFVYNAETGSVLENLINYGAVSGQRDQSAGGATSVMAGGIAGAANGSATSGRNTISGCVNYGDMTVDMERASGIVATTNHRTDMIACINYGNQTNSYNNTRVGMVTSAMAGNSTVTDCENHGNAIMTATQVSGKYSRVGGLVGIMNSSQVSLTGGGNYGKIVSDCTNGRGLLVAWFSDLKSMSDVVAGGSMYSYNGGEHQQIEINSSNYMTYIGSSQDAADKEKISNIIYIGPDAVGIRTADELVEFATLVNSEKDYSKFMNMSGVVTLLADIDMSGKTWTPIGNATHTLSSNKLTVTGTAFTGHFNGNGHTIKNLDMVCTSSVAGSTYGLFGTLGSGAVVENLVMDVTSSLTVNATTDVQAGVVAGLVYDAAVRNVVNNAPMQFNSGAAEKRTTMGVVGLAFAQNSEVEISRITNNAAIAAAGGGNVKNNGDAAHISGILGFGTNHADSKLRVVVSGCENNGNITSATGRTSSIVAACNRYTTVQDCENKGNITNSYATSGSARIGAVTCITGAECQILNTVNHGDVVCTTKGAAAGVVCLVSGDDCLFSGVENYGDVITDHASYKGTFFGQCNNESIFRDCVCQGDLGTYNDGSYKMTGTNAYNYFDYIGVHNASAIYVTPLNIRWGDQVVQAAPTFPALWQFSATSRQLYESEWVNYNRIPCTYSSPATISVVRAEANASKAFNCMAVDGSGTSARPYVGNLLKDDYWLWTLPVDYVPAGTYVLFNATIAGGQDSPKYYILEYYDQGQWKQASLLRTVSEDNTKKYSFAVFGVQNGGKYQHSTFTHVLKFEDEFINSSMKIRLRVPVDVSCSGGKLSLTSEDGTCSLAPMGFTGSYVNIMGNKDPKDTKRVLAIGNSFSHYHDPSWKLVEIAFAEGHKIEMFGHFKGSQTFANHLELWLTTVAINMGKFHYAFIQDQSSAHANYASDKTANAATLTNSQALKDKILAKVPTCNVILENTWSFAGSNGNYGGFTSFENFDNLLLSGSLSIAKSIGSPVSPIGQAFKLARERHPEIELYHSDVKHQGPYGAYLKACVNYLVLYGEPFGSTPADCGLNPTYTAKLRAVAEDTVLGNESKYYITR